MRKLWLCSWSALGLALLAGSPLSAFAQESAQESIGQPSQDVGDAGDTQDDAPAGDATPPSSTLGLPPPVSPATVSPAAADDAQQYASPVQQEAQEDAFPKFEVGARLIAGAEWITTHPSDEQEENDSRQPFFLKQARVKLRARLTDRIYMSFSADLEGKPPIRSAFLDAKFKRYLRLRVGRFKRPISRIELTSVGDLPFPDRGIFNASLIERAGWGDRALGLMVHGKVKRPKLRYYLALMNAAPTIDVDDLQRLRGVDLLARVEYRPLRSLSIGINGGHKTREARVDGPNLSMFGVGGDVKLALGDFTAVVEVLAAQNPFPPAPPLVADRSPWALVTMGYATYDLRLSNEATLQPVLATEWVDTDLDVSEDEALRMLAGVNLLWLEDLRIMPRVEIVRPLGSVGARSYVASETYSLVVSMAL